MTVFVGREGELGRIAAAIDAAAAGEGRLLLFAGEAGIGKSAIAARAASMAIERGVRAVWGRCWEAGGAPPFWPWIEALGELFPDEDLLESADKEGDAARLRLFDRVAKRLRTASEERPLVLLLDDLHAADAPTLLFLHFLSRRLKPGHLTILGTFREADAHLVPQTGELIAKIMREGEIVRLTRLARDEVAQMLGSGCAETRLEEIHRASEGNPLFVVELLKLGPGGAIPHGLVAVLHEHLRRLSAGARTLLEAGAVIGRTFSTKDAASIAGIDLDSAFGRIAEAQAILDGSGDARTFVHVLFCERLRTELAPSRLAELEWRTGEACLARGDLSRAAHHLLAGAVDTAHAIDVAKRAIAFAMERLAFEEAAAIAERALAVLGPKETEQHCEILVLLGEALIRAGQTQAGRDACLRAAKEGRALGRAALEAKAALVYSSEIASGSVDPVMVELLRSARAALEAEESNAALRARVLARLAAAMVPPKDEAEADEVLELARTATVLARTFDDPDTLLFVLQFSAAAAGYLTSDAERFPGADEIVALAQRLDRPMILVNAGGWHITSLIARGRRGEAMEAYARYRELILSLPAGHYHWRVHGLDATLALLDGAFERAEAHVAEMARVSDKTNMSASMATMLMRVGIAHASGNPASIAPYADEILQVFSRFAPLIPYGGWVLAAIGRKDEARKMLCSVVYAPRSFPWLLIAGDAIAMLEDRELAEQIYPTLSRHAFSNRAFWGPAGTTTLGPTSRTLGDLAMVLGKRDEALKHYDDAIEFCERIGARALLARSKEGRARALGDAPLPRSTRAAPMSIALAREGDIWKLTAGSAVIRLKDAKGLAYLERLLERPGQEIHVADLVGLDAPASDAGPMLDARAKEAYRRRLEDLNDELEEARKFRDAGRIAKVEAELEAIGDELARGVGLGGRDRKAASNVERARINVQRRLKDVIERVREHDASLGKWLEAAVKTGTYCSFDPA